MQKKVNAYLPQLVKLSLTLRRLAPADFWYDSCKPAPPKPLGTVLASRLILKRLNKRLAQFLQGECLAWFLHKQFSCHAGSAAISVPRGVGV